MNEWWEAHNLAILTCFTQRFGPILGPSQTCTAVQCWDRKWEIHITTTLPLQTEKPRSLKHRALDLQVKALGNGANVEQETHT